MEYRVVLDGGANVAVVPADFEGPYTEMTPVLLYSTTRKQWTGRQKLGSVTAHAPYWTVPDQPVILNIEEPVPVPRQRP